MTNLLKNSDFEGSTTRDTTYWTPEGGPFHTQFGEITAPAGWTVWWREGFGDGTEPDQLSGRPEAKVIRLPHFPDETRIKFGSSAMQMFTFWMRHDMGLYQSVAATRGTKYKFSAYAHSWYSRCSTEPHEGRLDSDCRTEIEWAECWLCLGIDPLGGTDPYREHVEWGSEYMVYGDYSDLPMTVEATAQGDTITVFLHSWTTHALKHNDTYWDGAVLEVAEVPPREYERTYVLYPPDATLEEVKELTETNWLQRRTVGGSADDAAIGHPNLTKRTVIVWRPQRWDGGKVALQGWFDLYYPGIDEIVWIEDGPVPPSGLLLWQCDPAWRTVILGDENCGETICRQGCFITSLAMAQRYYEIDENATPLTVHEALGDEGYNGCYTAWVTNPAHVTEATGLDIAMSFDRDKIKRHIMDGGAAMAEVSPASYNHFVLVTDYDQTNDRFWMHDPYRNVEGWLDVFYGGVDSWRILKKVEPSPPVDLGRIGLHLQQEIGDWRGLVEKVVPMKFLAGIQNMRTVLQINPKAFPIWRQWVPDQGTFLTDSGSGATRYIDTFRDSMEEVIAQIAQDQPGLPKPWFGVESLNEIYACFDPSVQTLSIPFDRAFIQALAAYPEVAPCVYVAAVGNIDPSEYHTLLDLARECEAAKGCFSYHPYFYANPTETGLIEPHWEWLAGRWQYLDQFLTENGIKVRWALGEMGAVGGYFVHDTVEMTFISPLGARLRTAPRAMVNMGATDDKPERVFVSGNSGYVLLPGDGWKSPQCMGGDWDRFEADLLEFNRRLQVWNESHEYRAYGGTIFTTGGGSKWKHFEIDASRIERLKEIL